MISHSRLTNTLFASVGRNPVLLLCSFFAFTWLPYSNNSDTSLSFYFFLCVYVSIREYIISCLKDSLFCISFSANVLEINFLSFYFSETFYFIFVSEHYFLLVIEFYSVVQRLSFHCVVAPFFALGGKSSVLWVLLWWLFCCLKDLKKI